MNKSICFVLIFTLFQNKVFSQNLDIIVKERWGNGKPKFAYKKVGKDSIAYEYYESGILRGITKFKERKMVEGTMSAYYESGKLNFEMIYDSTSNDKTRHNLLDEYGSFYRRLYRSWYETGELQRIEYYNKGKTVQYTEFYKNSKIKAFAKMDNDAKYVFATTFYDNGYLEFEYTMYKDTSLSVPNYPHKRIITYPSYRKHWYSNGGLESEGAFQLDDPKGYWVFYTEDGLLKKEENYDAIPQEVPTLRKE